jgi:RNA polymerase sigma-70 factor, ECF subfamily
VLIRQIAGGDQLAMQILFARHRVALYRWLLRLVRDEALAENLLSDVFLDVWRQAAKFEARSSVSTWLLAIARYKGLSARRRRIDAEFGEEVAVIIADPADNPELVLQKKNQAELVRHSLARLCLSTARSSTLFTITANRSERLPRLSESPRPRSRRACSMRAKN